MKNYAVQSDGNHERNKRIIKAFEALGVENKLNLDGRALNGVYYAPHEDFLSCICFVVEKHKIITLEELEELAYNLPKEGDLVWAWDDDNNIKTKRSYLGVFKDWHMVQGKTYPYPIPYKNVQKINPNEEKIKELESKIKEIQKELEELK
jgi:hypothetical protein